VFDARAIDVLRGIFVDVCSDAQAALVEMDGDDDQVHLLASLSALSFRPEGRGLPRVSVSAGSEVGGRIALGDHQGRNK